MTTTLEDNNASPLSTITFSPEPDVITGGFSRVPQKGEKIFDYSTTTRQGYIDLKTTVFVYTLNIVIKTQAMLNLITEYKLKENKTGFKLTIPRKPTTTGEPFNHSYMLVIMEGFNYVDIGGTEKPYFLATLKFRLVEFV